MKTRWFRLGALTVFTLAALFLFETKTARAATTYTWTQATSTDYQLATNWTPARVLTATDDILIFDGATTPSPAITNVPTQTIGRLRTVNGANTATFSATGSVTLTIAGDGNSGTADFEIDSTSFVILSGANAISVSLAAGASGSVSGQMTVTGGAHKLLAANASGITFQNGAVFYTASGFTGNAFGSGGTSNTIVFASGSQYQHNAGSNPFGSAAPSSKVVFQSGSLYVHRVSAEPSFSGRTYANFEYDNSGGTSSASGTGALSMDNLTVTAGTLNIGMTGTFNLKGNISIANGATLNFNPASAATVTWTGSVAQSISNSGTLTFQPNQNVMLNNANGLVLNSDIALGGTLTFTNGKIDATSKTLTLDCTASVSGADSSRYILGNVKKTFCATGSFTYPVGTTNGYSPVDATLTALGTNPSSLQMRAVQSNATGLADAKSLDRYWTLTETGNLTTHLTFTYLAGDVDGNETDYRLYRGTSEVCGVSCVNEVTHTATINDVSEFSNWSAGEGSAPTAADLLVFTARQTPRQFVRVSWETGTELNIIEFNVHRARNKNGPFQKLNAKVIPAKKMGTVQGANYRLRDEHVKKGKRYLYKIEIIRPNGTSEWSDVIRVTTK